MVSNSSYLRIFTKLSFLYATTLRYFTIGFLFSPFLLTVFFLFKFTFREVGVSSASMVSSICLGIISTELLLFVSFFWGAYTGILSPSYVTDSTTLTPTEGIVGISSRGLIVTITFLLSTASVILGYGILTSEKAITLNIQRGFTVLVLIALSFTSIQVCEYLGLAVSINDGALGTYLFTLTGLHFSHVLVGAILLFFSFWRGSLQYNPNIQTRTYTSSSIMVLPLLESYTLLYWHFVEAIWLVIHFTFYTL
uniref:Cytochrome c oxidase subunit 3 n=1 Tax=Lankesterella sp. Guelph2013 TaxID=1821735 RepID=A0A1B0VF95_9APIC|nr:cytochrome c oxidase subunit 3 [Lankesterella sp. Guelph2013]AMV74037.1 cytochrome c oxidase subunit 3 [Lankesterella sp. Guelph2013]